MRCGDGAIWANQVNPPCGLQTNKITARRTAKAITGVGARSHLEVSFSTLNEGRSSLWAKPVNPMNAPSFFLRPLSRKPNVGFSNGSLRAGGFSSAAVPEWLPYSECLHF